MKKTRRFSITRFLVGRTLREKSNYHHERPVRRTGRPAKRAGTHRGTVVARKDDVLPMVRREKGRKDDDGDALFCCSLSRCIECDFPNVFLSLSFSLSTARMTTTTTTTKKESARERSRRRDDERYDRSVVLRYEKRDQRVHVGRTRGESQ